MTKTKETFVDKVKAFLKLDDDGKIQKFQKENIKVLKQQIAIRENEKDDISEKLAEKKEELTEKSLDVYLEKIKTLSDRKYYIETYNSALLHILDEIDTLGDDYDTKNDEIERFERLIDLIK